MSRPVAPDVSEPSATTAPAVPGDRLGEAIHALRDIPSSPLELGRRFEAELGFRARADVLQAVAGCASVERPDALDVLRRSFAFHVVSIETLRTFWSEPTLTGALSIGDDRWAWILGTRRSLTDAFVELAAAADAETRTRLERARDTLLPDPAPLAAARVLRPAMAALVTAAAEGRLDAELGEVAASEYERVEAACSVSVADDQRPARRLVDAIVLRVLMRRRQDAHESAPDEATRAALEAVRDVYRFVSDRLQELCDRRPDGNVHGDAGIASEIRKRLFSAYRDVVRTLNTAPGDRDDEALRERMDAAERAAAEMRAAREATESVLEQAVESSKAARSTPPRIPESVRDLRAERRRRTALLVAAGGMVACAVTVNVVLWRGGSGAARATPAAPFAPVQQALPSSTVVVAGDVVYAEVSTWVWKDMGREERLDHVARAVGAAGRDGMRVLYVVDESGRELARWSRATGVELLDR